jgi:hypothetical protein
LIVQQNTRDIKELAEGWLLTQYRLPSQHGFLGLRAPLDTLPLAKTVFAREIEHGVP